MKKKRRRTMKKDDDDEEEDSDTECINSLMIMNAGCYQYLQ